MTDKQVMSERRKAFYEADFDPGVLPGSSPPAELRLALAAEYMAYQLGQINHKLDKLIAALDAKT